MSFDAQVFLKALSPTIASKAMNTFDRATTVVVGACWAGAVLIMAFAVYTMTLSVSAKREAEAALVGEPSLPKIERKGMEARKAQIMIERLQKSYPEVNFSLQNNQILNVTAIDGSRFKQWLTALSYIDTISPEYHWAIQEFCVGKCRGGELMRATLRGENVYFKAPDK